MMTGGCFDVLIFIATISELVVMGTSSLMRSSLMAIRTPPYPSALSFLNGGLYPGGMTSLSNMDGLSHVSQAIMTSGVVVSTRFQKASFLALMLWRFRVRTFKGLDGLMGVVRRDFRC